MFSIRHRIADQLRSIIGGFIPINYSNSRYLSHGLLTPNEFVESGDYLVLQFPNWFWRSASEGYEVKWLPKNKQYLHIDNLPCRKRLNSSNLGLSNSFVNEVTKNAEWLAPCDSKNLENEADNELRYYDISITYDKYFQTPRIWLLGFDKNGTPLSTEEMVQDIISDYTTKTVTIDPHPSNGIQCISIHPCNHSKILKRMSRYYPPHLSIVVLLKFITTVIPSIELDNTIDIDIKYESQDNY
ncbi:autophagocytosis protein [Cryptosporidium ryanae]|uniref:autophagocytosis protein n=1 Tax=Cryptosporidium ryanae TaxID=515981 RepID=UPI00351AB081|nr:autophagocytosis protein [Cryptosporidium ryanae]